MAAPKGNQFWKNRSRHGRKKLFSTAKILWNAAAEYFEWCEENPLMEAEIVKAPHTQVTETPIINPKTKKETTTKTKTTIPYALASVPKMRPFTLTGLCLYLDCNSAYFRQFKAELVGKEDKASKDFSTIITRIEEIIYTQKFEGAAAGFLNPNIIARDLGLSDRKEVDHTTQGESLNQSTVDLSKLDLETLKKLRDSQNNHNG